MTPVITYSLRGVARDSDEYYRAIAAFADRWMTHALEALKDILPGIQAFRQEHGLPSRSNAEYAFELLALGVLLREHGAQAARTPAWTLRALQWLVDAQVRWPQAEAAIKTMRGWVGRLGTRLDEWRGRSLKQSAPGGGQRLAWLIRWLRAHGNGAQAERLAQWQDYLDAGGERLARGMLARCLSLAAEFDRESLAALGPYTEGVQRFLTETAKRYRHRYDAELLSRSRLEYHLGMLGTEVLSRAYRDRFLAARRKIVILPPCMRAQPDDRCRAIETPVGAQCQGCTPGCRVHQITQLGRKRGFEVYLIPDELRVVGAEASRAMDGVGLVGVSCALTNWGGGWEAEALGVPAQGVLLDYVGCRYHWHETGIVTDTNLRKLADIVGAASLPRKHEEIT